jgi:hypothetical protein
MDGDGTPSFLDADSDDDGVSDRDEVGGQRVCQALSDCDGDGAADTEDQDSDNDLLLDARERTAGFSSCMRDTNGNVCDDLAEFELGGCDLSRVSASVCNESVDPHEPIVRLTVTRAAERLEPHLEIVKLVNQFDPAWIEGVRPVELNPASAGTIEGSGFSNVTTDAMLGVAVSFAPTRVQFLKNPWALIAVRAYTPSGALSGEGLLLVVIGNCPPILI